MRRRKPLLSPVLIAFGAGFLLAKIFPAGVLFLLFAVMLVAVGAGLLRK